GQALALANGKFTLAAPLAVSSLTLLQGATLAGPAPVAGSAPVLLGVTASGAIRVQCGAAIDVSAQGYPAGVTGHPDGYGPPGVAPAHGSAIGASHGGEASPGPLTGTVYDSVYQPQMAGAGGATGGNPFNQGTGSGAITLSAASFLLSGKLVARGADQ